MATTETKGLMTYVDKNGNKFLIYPVTKAELVDGLDEAMQAFAAGLNYDDRYYTEAEIDQKLQGLPTAGHKHTKSDITDFPALGTAAAKNAGDFAAASHTHDDRYYTESEMNAKLNGKANASHTHDDRYYTESEMNTKLNGKANSSHTHNYAGSSSAGGTANSVNGLTFAAQTTDPGAGSSLATNKVLIVYA